VTHKAASALGRSSQAPVEMKEKETKAKDSIEYILESLLEILSQNKHVDDADGDDTSFVRAPMEIYASPEEGVRLIRAFVGINQPELRAAIIKIATQLARR
jgi:hypothetical protein